MPFNYYDTHHLLASVQQLAPLHTFLLDRYFPTNAATDIFSTERVQKRQHLLWRLEREELRFFVKDIP